MKRLLFLLLSVLLLSIISLASYVLGFDRGAQSVPPAIEREYVSFDESQNEKVLWALVQDWRLRTGKAPYIEDLGLCAIAVERAGDATIDFNHTGFREKGPGYIETYGLTWVGENLVKLKESSSDALGGWLNSPTHRNNLEDTRFTHGCIRCVNYACAHILGAY